MGLPLVLRPTSGERIVLRTCVPEGTAGVSRVLCTPTGGGGRRRHTTAVDGDGKVPANATRGLITTRADDLSETEAQEEEGIPIAILLPGYALGCPSTPGCSNGVFGEVPVLVMNRTAVTLAVRSP